ncbi:MTH938/NDUFAF3 family protein [Micromonospora sp. NPDC049559]|uniref:Mth938-like domain-containing protein n=1 Tax=Micromonospora sp. NPDC049559 TaxID=3155923 RepID=UPI00342A7769
MESGSPRVLSVSWGRMEVEGLGEGKDFKLYPGGGREWDWSETGTRHSPGVQPGDVEELLAHGATSVVIGRGLEVRLEVDPATLALLRQHRVTVHSLGTEEAVELYHRLAAEGPVGALFHSTC